MAVGLTELDLVVGGGVEGSGLLVIGRGDILQLSRRRCLGIGGTIVGDSCGTAWSMSELGVGGGRVCCCMLGHVDGGSDLRPLRAKEGSGERYKDAGREDDREKEKTVGEAGD